MAARRDTTSGFGAYLRERRHTANLTQQQLAALAGISVRTVSDLERGVKHSPRMHTARVLGDALGLVGDEHAAFLATARKPIVARRTPMRTASPSPSRLPAPATRFVGRTHEVAAVTGLLQREDVRLLTLTGPGGIGKTRLALHAAAIVSDTRDEVVFVDLASVGEARHVLPTIARTLGVQETADRSLWDGLVARLAGTRLLLLLDTCERLLGAAGDVADLLATCGGLTVVATSRVPLRIRAERQFPVGPLPVPDLSLLPSLAELMAMPSVAVFLDRAQAVRPDITLTPDTAPAVAAICRRLGGLPLAIELAAARVDTLLLPEMRHQLDLGLGFLADGPRDLPQRQQTLVATLAWSYETLAEEEQRLLRRLSVFAGSCTLAAVAAVCNSGEERVEGLDITLRSLAAKHLVVVETTADGTVRYRLQDLVHEFAYDLATTSGDVDEAHDRHAAFFRDFAEASEVALGGPDQRGMLDRLEFDHDNLRAALTWSLDHHDAETALRLASALWSFWEMRGYVSEGRAWLDRALALDGHVPPRIQARALTAAAGLADAQGDYDRAEKLYQRAMRLWRASGDRIGLARALNNLAIVHDNQGAYDAAYPLYEQAIRLFRELGDDGRTATALNNLGTLAFARGAFPQAAALHEEAHQLRGQAGDEQGIAASLTNLATAVSALGDEERTRTLLNEALRRYRTLGDPAGVASVLLNLGVMAWRRRDLTEAKRCYEDALRLQRRLEDKQMIAMLLINLAEVLHQQGDDARAFRLLRESLAMRQALGTRVGMALGLLPLAEVVATAGHPARAVSWIGTAEATLDASDHALHPAERAALERRVDALRDELGEAVFMEARERGRATTLETAIAEAFSLEHVIAQQKHVL